LTNLLYETNGIDEKYGISVIWSLDQIKKDNLYFRSLKTFKEIYMPFDCLLFFADAGNGDQFAFPVVNGSHCKDDVFVWNHEDDSRTWVAPSLQKGIPYG
jgi:hypothetical protein